MSTSVYGDRSQIAAMFPSMVLDAAEALGHVTDEISGDTVIVADALIGEAAEGAADEVVTLSLTRRQAELALSLLAMDEARYTDAANEAAGETPEQKALDEIGALVGIVQGAVAS